MKLVWLYLLPVVASCLCLPYFVGCGSTGGGAGGTAVDEEGVKAYPVKNVLQADFETPDLDNGRIRVPTPKGWKRGDRQGGVQIRFYVEDQSGLPRLLVFAEPSRYKSVEMTTEENVFDLADEIQAELDQKQKESGKTQYREPCKPLMLGDTAWVRYVAAGKWHGHGVDRVLLKTVANKRIYTVELNVMSGKISDFQKAAYSVAGRMVFNSNDGTPAATPVDAKPVTEEK